MNEVWLRRLVGGGAVFVAALVLTLLLPNARRPAPVEGEVHTVDLRPADERSELAAADTDEYAPETLPFEDGPNADDAAMGAEGATEAMAVEPPPAAVPPRGGAVDAAPAEPAPAPTPVKPAAPTPKPAPEPEPSTPIVRSAEPAVAKPPPVRAEPPPVRAEPPPAPKTTPAPPAAKPAAPATASSGGNWRVLAGAYSSIDNARRVEASIKGLGLSAIVAPIEVNGATLYRVTSGPFPSKSVAEQAQKRIQSTGAQTRVMQD